MKQNRFAGINIRLKTWKSILNPSYIMLHMAHIKHHMSKMILNIAHLIYDLLIIKPWNSKTMLHPSKMILDMSNMILNLA
jgi:hypothetical protein